MPLEKHTRIGICLALFASLAHAQAWRSWDAGDGLADSYIDSIDADSDGSIWLSHGPGAPLSVIDGYSVETVRPPVGSDPVFAVDYGELWVLAPEGIQHRAGTEWQLLGVPPISRLSSDARLATRIFVARPGLAFLLSGHDLYELRASDGAWRTLTTGNETGLGGCSGAALDDDGVLWAGCQRGVLRYDPEGESEQIRTFPYPSGAYRDGKRIMAGPRGEIFLVARMNSSTRYAGLRLSSQGWDRVWTSDEENLRIWRAPDQSLRAIEGSRYLLIRGGVAVEIAGGSESSDDYGAVLQARNGTVWIGTTRRLRQHAVSVWTLPAAPQPITQPVHAAVEDPATGIWFAASGHLSNLRDGAVESFALPDGVKTYSLHTNAVGLVGDRTVALKTERTDTLLLFDIPTATFRALSHPEGRRFRLITPRSDRKIWVNTSAPGARYDQRVELFDGERFELVHERNGTWNIGRMRFIYESSDGATWFGGTEGLSRLKDGVFETFTEPAELQTEGSYALAETADGKLWSAGRTRLIEFDGANWREVAQLGKVRSLLRGPGGSMWAIGERGARRLEDGIWNTHTSAEGLPDTVAYMGFVDSRRNLWVGTARGVTRWTPEHDTAPPQVTVMSGVDLQGRSADPAAEFRFVARDRWRATADSRLRYSYSLDGGAWSEPNTRTSTILSGLETGPHVLNVRVLDRAGNVGELDGGFPFSIAPPWYLQRLFLLGVVVVGCVILALLAYALHSYRRMALLVGELKTATGAAELAQAATEETVRQRTEALRIANTDLRDSRERAENASRLKSEFVANMSHEVRSPLTVIMGLTELLLSARVAPEQRAKLEKILASSESLLAIVNDILDFSKIEANQLTLKSAPFGPGRLAVEIVDELRPTAHRKNLALSVSVDEGTPVSVLGDALRVRQALTNLVQNAIKFTAEGWIVVAVGSLGDGRLLFRVADTGVGIPPKEIEEIFSPFRQADGSMSRRHGGTGLGLTISKRLAELMGGTLRVKSELSKGTTFELELPFDAPTEQEAPALEPKLEVPAGQVTRASLRILVAEDREDTFAVINEMLERDSHRVVWAKNGREATRLAAEQTPDLVLMDVQMPEMDGLEATRQIRAAEPALAPRIPIIGITANAMRGDREICLEAGMDDYLAKPVDLGALRSALTRAAERRAIRPAEL